MNFLKRLFESDADIPKMELTPADHTHEWELITKTYGEPRHDSVSNFSEPEQVDRALFGVTNLFFQCVVCKAFKKESMSGLDATTLDQLVDKVNVHGPQYYQRDGITYVVQRHTPQSYTPLATPRIDPTTNLPIR